MIFDIDDIDDGGVDFERAVVEYLLMAQRKVIREQVRKEVKEHDAFVFISHTIGLIIESMGYDTPVGMLAKLQTFNDGSDSFKEVGFSVLEEANSYLDNDERKTLQSIFARLSDIFRPTV